MEPGILSTGKSRTTTGSSSGPGITSDTVEDSQPEERNVLKKQLIVVFVGVVATGIVVVGYLFNNML